LKDLKEALIKRSYLKEGGQGLVVEKADKVKRMDLLKSSATTIRGQDLSHLILALSTMHTTTRLLGVRTKRLW
jgi:hypothetical protein